MQYSTLGLFSNDQGLLTNHESVIVDFTVCIDITLDHKTNFIMIVKNFIYLAIIYYFICLSR